MAPGAEQAQATGANDSSPRETGLSAVLDPPSDAQSRGKGKRKSVPSRTGMVWAEGVKVTGNEMSNTPNVQCLWCQKNFSGGITRIREHFLGGGSIQVCTNETEQFCNFKDKIASNADFQLKEAAKKAKALEKIVDANVERATVALQRNSQRSIDIALNMAQSKPRRLTRALLSSSMRTTCHLLLRLTPHSRR